MLPLTLLATAVLPLFTFVAAQDGGITGPTTSAGASGYSCDPTKCKLPNCNCASASPPGGLQPVRYALPTVPYRIHHQIFLFFFLSSPKYLNS